jgi:hypothetical protein
LFLNQPKEFAMKGHMLVVTMAALLTATALSTPAANAGDPFSTTDPGFVPDTGQINPGHAAQPWSATPALRQDQQPAQEDARAALMMPDNGAPSAGQGTTAAPNSGEQSTTGGGATSSTAGASAGPIGATLQTMPAKFSHRNDLLDHLPVMAWPLELNEQQRQQIYKTVMTDKSQPVSFATTLKPGDSLSFEQRHEMHPLPQDVSGIDGLQGLKFVKGKDKVLLVRPSSGIIVDEVTM